jgi:hypothetical protein
MLTLIGILAFIGIAFWGIVSANKEAIDGYGVGGWLFIIFIIAPVFTFFYEQGIFWEFLIISNIILWSWLFGVFDRD